MGKPVIFTDLDGTLLDCATYSFEPALPALRLIGEMDIPIVFCSSKTRDEIECCRRSLGNSHPFITENGGGILIPAGYFDPRTFPGHVAVVRENGYLVIRLGAKYSVLRRTILELRNEGFRITGFGDMSVAEVAELTELSHDQARLAKKRDFDEPFIFDGNEAETVRLLQAIRAKGLSLTSGRFFHLLGDSDKGKAVALLIGLYRKKYGEITTIAVGDGPNDIPMLERVDHPILVRQPDGSHNSCVDTPRLIRAEGIGPEGWNSALLGLLPSLEPFRKLTATGCECGEQANLKSQHWNGEKVMDMQMKVSLYDIVAGLSSALDLVSPRVVNHHQRVAYFASSIAAEMGVEQETLTDITVAGLIHDAGAISLQNRLDIMDFEVKSPHEHAERGYLFIKPFTPFATVAKLVRHHHVQWEDGQGAEFRGEPVLPETQILHLADRIDVLIDRREPILGQVRHICQKIRGHSTHWFMPEALDAFLKLAHKEYFWLYAVSPAVESILASRMAHSAGAPMTQEILEDIAGLFSRIIDFRSHFTAMHSGGVGIIAEHLAKCCGMMGEEPRQVRIAGLLHDLGKLCVSKEILEKPEKLTPHDYSIIRAHTFHTYRVLERIRGFENICRWAGYHHERLDGSGYPFHISGEEYSLGARIVSIADIFTAITEDRPYRKGKSVDKTLKVLAAIVKKGKLDGNVVSMVQDHHRELNALRVNAQKTLTLEYESVTQHFSRTSAGSRWGYASG